MNIAETKRIVNYIMPNTTKTALLERLNRNYGKPKPLSESLSLFEIGNGLARIYVRYSKMHSKRKTFYGLRQEDLKRLEGFNSAICFLTNEQAEPIFIPYSEFEDVFNSLTPASDGQYKVQIYMDDGTELYIANAGRFNVESFCGWDSLEKLIDRSRLLILPNLSHVQVQTYLGSIGALKGYDIWIPPYDRGKLDWLLTDKFECRNEVPSRYKKVDSVVREVDVAWLQRGSTEIKALFEVEHSTPIYTGLLRFNDVHLIEPHLKMKFNIVSNDTRRALFLKQISRPTFKASGLGDLCNFLEYGDVYSWYLRTRGVTQ